MAWGGIADQVRAEAELVRRGEWREVAQHVREWIWSDWPGILLRRDLSEPIEVPPAKVELEPRPYESRDAAVLFPDDLRGRDFVESRRALEAAELGLPDRWVFVDTDDRPCYFQWVARVDDDPRVAAFFGDETVALTRGQGILEGAWTPPARRKDRVASHAIARLCEMSRDQDRRYLYTFIGTDNGPALKVAARAGFVPYLRRDGSWRFGRHRITIGALAPDEPGR